jgi:hypothetical protein
LTTSNTFDSLVTGDDMGLTNEEIIKKWQDEDTMKDHIEEHRKWLAEHTITVRASDIDDDPFEELKFTKVIDEIFETQTTTTCEHAFKEYVGLTSRFEYCTFCDVKR